MQAPPDDLFQRDSTIPTVDPAVAAEHAKQRAQLEKERKALEAQEKKRAAAEEKKVKKDIGDKPVVPKETPSEAAKKRELKAHKIRLYFEKLGHKLSFKAPKSLPSNDIEIDELLARIECELHSNGGIEQAGTAYVSMMAGIEQLTQVWNPLGLQLSGPAASLSSTLQQNKEKWDELLTEFAISNAEWFMVGPFKRILLFSAQLVIAVDTANKMAIGGARNASEDLKKYEEQLNRVEKEMGKGKEEA